MKNTKRYLSILLALCLVLSCVPAAVFAAEDDDTAAVETLDELDPIDAVVDEETVEKEPSQDELPAEVMADMATITKNQSVSLDTSKVYKVFHLDCGRKYFTVDHIKAIIDTMGANDYTHLELAIGNDGMRFLLDDMSVTVDGTTYSSANVTAGIKAGNKAYCDCGTNELTQAEMDEIITYASGKGIEIIPLVNTPGHMDAILTAMKQVGISNPNYSTSVRTVDITNGTAANFTLALVNKYIQYFAGKGCKIFNMGADEYANDIQSQPQFGGLISSRKYGSFVNYVNNMAAQIQNAGMTPMAFNDGIYYNQNTSYGTFDENIVISYWSSGWSGYNVASASYLYNKGHKILNTNGNWYYVLNAANGTSWNTAKSNLQSTPYDSVQGSTVPVVGAMICYWCDTPSYSYSSTEQQHVQDMITTFAAANPTIFDLNKSDPTPATVWNEDKTISVTAQGLTSVTTTKDTNLPEAVKIPDGTTAVAYEITPETASGYYTASAEVTVKLPSGFGSTVKVYSVNANGLEEVLGATVSDDVATFTAPHFSTYLLANGEVTYEASAEQPSKTETITITVGQSTTRNITGANYAGTYTLDPAEIATVTVTGKDKVEGSTTTTYTSTSVTRSTLTNGKTSWTKTNYFYKVGDNYYPVYAYQRYSYGGRYYYGYSTTDSASNVKEIDNSTNGNGSWTVYEAKTTTVPATDASTTITFTGVKAGTTYVTIGDTKYTINVSRKSESVTITVGNSASYTDTYADSAVSADTNIATAIANGNNLTITGVAVGNTTVTTDTTVYNVTVDAEDLSIINTTIEFWITNRVVTANNATSMTLNAATSTVYSENGAAVADLVPAEGSVGSDKMVFWKAVRLASDNKQTTGSGDDKTLSGTDFTKIRYYEGSWAYFDGNTWTNFATGDQIVAYYLQETNVTDEITTLVVDWGPVKKNWSDLNYLNTKYVLLDYSVKYESGEEVPSAFTNAKTLAFHCDTKTTNNGVYYRTIGMTVAVESSDYEVYMITATPTSDSTSSVLANTAAGNGTIKYAGTEKVVWAETQADLDNSGLGTWTSISGKYTYSVGGDPTVPGMEIYRQQGMKITYYVRAKITEDALTVNYVNQTTGENFYSYNIAVQSGTVFNEGIALANPSWKANLANGSVTNNLGKTQTVSADLSTMPAIGVSYRYSDYTCTEVVRSADGKTVTLYYTFNNVHNFVVDFGLPVKITAADLGISGDWTSATVTNAKYGTAVAGKDKGVTYTPTTVLQGVEQLSLNLTNGSETTTQIIYLYPATTVYYEESFANVVKGWSTNATGTPDPTSAKKVGGTHDVYGYTSAYNQIGASNGTYLKSDNVGDSLTFTFTGTGVDVYANTTTETGKLLVTVKNSKGKYVKAAQIDTHMKNGETGATSGQEVDAYNVPVFALHDLDRDTYVVTVNHIITSASDTAAKVMIDGFRVYGTIAMGNDAYMADGEASPVFQEVRDVVLAALNVTSTDDKGQVNAALDAMDAGAIILNSSSDVFTVTNAEDLKNNGPKNELYLQAGQVLVFKVPTDYTAQIGMKALNAQTSVKVAGDSGNTEKTLATSTDMFYSAGTGTVSIENTGSDILSLTQIKLIPPTVATATNASLGKLTYDDLHNAMLMLGMLESTDEDGLAAANLTVNVKAGDEVITLDLNARGQIGENHVITADEIVKAAMYMNLPKGYTLSLNFKDINVMYGQNVWLDAVAVERTTNHLIGGGFNITKGNG